MQPQQKEKALGGGAPKAFENEFSSGHSRAYRPERETRSLAIPVTPVALQALRDRRHELLAQVAGVEIELAMLQGDRPAACAAQARMFAAIAARRALRGLGPIGSPA